MPKPNLEWAPIPSTVLNIDATLKSGQTFRWRYENGEWLGVIGCSAVRLKPEECGFLWQTYPEPGAWELISKYFALHEDLAGLYADWVKADSRIAPATERFAGLRVLRQDPGEVFFSFLCASCNTIVKIGRSIRSLERRAGEPIAEIGGNLFYKFPTAEAISRLDEESLRSDLWGYRAPRLIDLAGHIAMRGPGWLYSLTDMPYREAHQQLIQFFGIGAKIADCICVFGLGHDEAVPVDTHIRRIATALYKPELKGKSLTTANYWTLANVFRERFGNYAGWAQQYLFLEDLRTTKS